jgi:hypothetical protein
MRLRQRRKQEQFAILAGVFIILLVGFRWSIGLPQHMDILFGDEAEYIRNGLDLFKIIRNDWGPAYNIWYKFLSLFFSDTIQLYYANYIIGGIGVSVFLFIALSDLNVNRIVALYVSFCFLVSSVNVNTWPRISHFVLLLVLIAIISIARITSDARKCLTFAILCYICAYARPDLFFAFLVLIPVSMYFMYKEKEEWKSFIPYLIILLVSILFFQFIFGFPSPTYKGGLNRLYSAFCQHYSMNYKYRTHAHFDAITEWIDFCKSKFPDCKTITDVLFKHPGDFIQNTFFNLKNYIVILFGTLLSFVFPTGIYHSKKAMFLSIIVLLMFLFIVIIHPEKRRKFLFNISQYKLILFLLLIFGLPSMGMCVIIFPRPHYILLHSLLLVFLIVILFQSVLSDLTFEWHYFIPIGLFFLFISPSSDDYRYMQYGEDMDNLCDQRLVHYLQKKKDKEYTVFTNYLNVTYMLPKNYTEFSTEFELKRGMEFSKILEERKINIILVSSNILQNPILLKDTAWNNLIETPESYSFRKVSYSAMCESYLLIKD